MTTLRHSLVGLSIGCLGACGGLAALEDPGSGGSAGHGGAGASGGEADGASDDSPTGGNVGGLKEAAPWPRAGQWVNNIARGQSHSYVSGKLKWTALLGHDVSPTSPVVDSDGAIYVGCDEGICAFAPDGSKLWSTGLLAPCPYASPAIGANSVIYSGCGAIEPASHSVKWPLKGVPRGAITVADSGTVYVTLQQSGGGRLVALSPAGDTLWGLDTPGWLPAIALGDGMIYYTSFGWDIPPDMLRAVDPSGGVKWTFDAGETLGTPIVRPDGTLVVPGSHHL